MAKRIILVHGRGFKPDKAVLERTWAAAITHGLERDRGSGGQFCCDQPTPDFWTHK